MKKFFRSNWFTLTVVVLVFTLTATWAVQPAKVALGGASPVLFADDDSTNGSHGNLMRVFVKVTPSNAEMIFSDVGWLSSLRNSVDLSSTTMASDLAESALVARSVATGMLDPQAIKQPTVVSDLDGRIASGFELGDIVVHLSNHSGSQVLRNGHTVVLNTPVKPTVAMLTASSAPPPLTEPGLTGASSGLMLALGYVDRASPGMLAPRKVGGTGEITPDGRVLPVGGVEAKYMAAVSAGATLFLVPTGQVGLLKWLTPSYGVPVVEVNTVEEGITALCSAGGEDALCRTSFEKPAPTLDVVPDVGQNDFDVQVNP